MDETDVMQESGGSRARRADAAEVSEEVLEEASKEASEETSEETSEEVLAEASDGAFSDTAMKREAHIILIGFMGAGKSTVGRCLSRKLSRQLLDTDAMIEARAGMTISEIFASQGEEAFRTTETEVLSGLAQRQTPVIVSTGGGMPMRRDNREALRNLGYVVWLRVRPETVCARLAGDTTRPLLAGDDRRQKARVLLAERDPIYEETAHLIVDADEREPEEIAQEILAKLPTGRIRRETKLARPCG